MIVSLDINKVPSILKECFLFYSFKIGNYLPSVNNEKKYVFNYTENSSLYNFANFIKEKKEYFLTINWLFDYFNYQFCYWNFVKEEKEKNNKEIYLIQLHWILGKKALKRYDSRTSKDSYFYHSSFFPKFQIKKNDLIDFLEEKKCLIIERKDEEDKEIKFNTINKKEENIKAKKYNTLDGFNLCLNFTTLFKFESSYCKKCNWKDNCKKILKNTYPKIYQKRVAQKVIKNRLKNEKN